MTSPTPPPSPPSPPPYVVVRVPVEAAVNARRIAAVGASVGAALAVPCLLGALALLVAGSPLAAAALVAAALFWGALAVGVWWWGHRSAAARSGFAAGATLVAVEAGGLDLGPGLRLPWSDVEAVGLCWFAFTAAPTLGRPGAVAGQGLIDATYERTGGNLGLAVAVFPRDPARLDPVASPTLTGSTVAIDPATGRRAVVVRLHRLVVDGDPAAVGAAVAAAAPTHGVVVLGTPTPPARPEPLPEWLRG